MTEDAQRAQTQAQKGRWDLAAAVFGQLVEREPDNLGSRYPHIRSLVEAGDRAESGACEDLLKRFGTKADHAQSNSIAWTCVLDADAAVYGEALVHLAEAGVAGRPERGRERSDVLNTLGASLYRAGRFGEAIRRLNESIQALDGGDVPKGFAFLAMAHHRLGHGDEAKRWLDKLVAYQPKDGADFSWDDVEIRILRREAESLILGSTPAVPRPLLLRQPGMRAVIREPSRNEGSPPVRRRQRLPRAAEMDSCPGLAQRVPRRLSRSSGKINSTTAHGAGDREPEPKPLCGILGGRGSVRAGQAIGSTGGSPSRNRVMLSRTIRCPSIPSVFKPCSCPRSNATSPRRAAVRDRECWTYAAPAAARRRITGRVEYRSTT